MNAIGHNERSYRLDALAADARRGLENVEKGEEFTIGGWLAYGHALNEGRALFPGDREFGQWVCLSKLDERNGQEIHPGDRQAAMWAAANAVEFEQARQRGNPRTIRGIHAKWKEIEAEQERARFKAERAQQLVDDGGVQDQPPEHTGEIAEMEPRPAAEGAEADAQDVAQADVAADAGAQALQIETDPEMERDEAARRALAKLTREALEDDLTGLRSAYAEERLRRKKAEAERDDFKARFEMVTSQSDLGRSLGLALRQRDTAKGRLGEELAKNARLGRRITFLEAEIARLQRSLEMQEIPLR